MDVSYGGHEYGQQISWKSGRFEPNLWLNAGVDKRIKGYTINESWRNMLDHPWISIKRYHVILDSCCLLLWTEVLDWWTDRYKVNLPITIKINHCHIIAKGGGQARTREDQLHRQVSPSHRVCPKKCHLAAVTSSGRSWYDGQLTLPDEGQAGVNGESWRTEYEAVYRGSYTFYRN